MTWKPDCDSVKVKALTQSQKDFLEFCEDFGWGKLEVTVKNGQPVMSREIERIHKHD